MRIFVTVLVVLAVLAVFGLAFIYSGTYNVAASKPHTAFMRWLLETTTDRSIDRRAEGMAAPEARPSDLQVGARHYAAVCVTCHGAPGVERSAIGKGLLPEPPELWREEEMDVGEVFWVVKHGIKFTGMPAFGPTHGDDDLWATARFVERLPSLSPAQYSGITGAAGAAPGGAALMEGGPGHEHGEGEAEH